MPNSSLNRFQDRPVIHDTNVTAKVTIRISSKSLASWAARLSARSASPQTSRTYRRTDPDQVLNRRYLFRRAYADRRAHPLADGQARYQPVSTHSGSSRSLHPGVDRRRRRARVREGASTAKLPAAILLEKYAAQKYDIRGSLRRLSYAAMDLTTTIEKVGRIARRSSRQLQR